jgi:hypothetical protein
MLNSQGQEARLVFAIKSTAVLVPFARQDGSSETAPMDLRRVQPPIAPRETSGVADRMDVPPRGVADVRQAKNEIS